MNYYKAYPSRKLTPYIKHYWGIETSFDGTEPYRQRIIPTGLPELIFYLNYRPQTSSDRHFEDNGILNIQQNDYYDLLISQSLDVFSIYFRPEAISLFFDLPLGQFLNNGIALSQLNNKLANEIQERLVNTKSFDERVKIAEHYLLNKLREVENDFNFRRMQHLIALISNSKGCISIDRLVDESCLSRKQFERKFIKKLGISPKQYLKIIRFQSTIHGYNIHPNRSLTSLAYDNGYYDQSHFINDVKSFTGESPKYVFDGDNIISDFYDV